MLELLFFGLWFFLPAGYANAAPVFANKIPALRWLGKPIDHGKTFRGKRIFGDHKTYRGFIVGIVVGVLTALLQYWIISEFGWPNIDLPISIKLGQYAIAGALLGLGALFGDAVKSFLKRQRGVASGQAWAPFDQIDYVIGGLAFFSLLETLSLEQYLSVAFVWVILHPIATFIGWLLRLKDSPL